MRKTILWLFGIAVTVRAIVAFLQVTYGIDNQANLDQYIYGPFNPGFELYHDFYGYYVKQITDLSQGLLPYKDFAYSYPPLFLYSMYPFFAIGGKYLASIPILLSDALTALLVFVIVNRVTNSRIAFLAGLSYALSPFFLLYEGYLWFSSQPMTFFLILSVYLLLVKKPLYSSAMLAVATLFKQEILVILPVYLIWYAKNSPKSFYKGFLTICALLFIVSLPFLLIAPGGYISSLSYGFIGHTYVPPLYPIASVTSNVTGGSTFATQSLVCSSIANTWRSLVCNFGGFTYTDYKSIPSWEVIFSPSLINMISSWVAVPLIASIFYYILKARNRETTYFLAMATGLIGFLTYFTLTIHPMLRYYLVPVYSLIVISSNGPRSLLIATVMPAVSLFLPSGPIQLLPPLFSVLALLMMDYTQHLHSPVPVLSAEAGVSKIQSSQPNR